jgi:hypothetical protein
MDGAALARHAQGALMAMIVRVAVCGSLLLEGVAHAFDGRLLLAGVNRIFFAVGFVSWCIGHVLWSAALAMDAGERLKSYRPDQNYQ